MTNPRRQTKCARLAASSIDMQSTAQMALAPFTVRSNTPPRAHFGASLPPAVIDRSNFTESRVSMYSTARRVVGWISKDIDLVERLPTGREETTAPSDESKSQIGWLLRASNSSPQRAFVSSKTSPYCQTCKPPIPPPPSVPATDVDRHGWLTGTCNRARTDGDHVGPHYWASGAEDSLIRRHRSVTTFFAQGGRLDFQT